MARRPDNREAEILREEHLKELRDNLAHLSLPAVRDFYEKAYQDCRLIYNRIPTPKQIQTLVQVWKQCGSGGERTCADVTGYRGESN